MVNFTLCVNDSCPIRHDCRRCHNNNYIVNQHQSYSYFEYEIEDDRYVCYDKIDMSFKNIK